MSIQPEILRKNYSRFLVEERILLTGHSHQAWPDCAESGVIEAFADAAELVDDKWDRAFAKAESHQIRESSCRTWTEYSRTLLSFFVGFAISKESSRREHW